MKKHKPKWKKMRNDQRKVVMLQEAIRRALFHLLGMDDRHEALRLLESALKETGGEPLQHG